jgi:glucose/arabinose dehydrogenase
VAALATSGCADASVPGSTAPAVEPALVLAAAAAPGVRVDTLVSGLAIPWDVTVLPDGGLLFTERAGATHLRRPDGTVVTVDTGPSDVFVGSEAGLMGIVADPAFSTNRTYYTCQAYRGTGTAAIDIRVVRWQLAADGTSATRSGAPVVTGIPITTGQHAGCRLRFAPDGTLHIGTGDAITGTNPQDLDSLGGKTLRVNPDGSVPATNPFAAAGGNRALVYTYGHRNVQGMALRPGTNQMWNVEHGPSVDDEVNLLSAGGNYGWDPVPGYNQNVPMTDTTKYPNAIPAKWRSGSSTVATSGGTFLVGSKWGRWEGALAVAQLKNEGVRILSITPDSRVRGDELFPQLDKVYGRIRTVQSAPGGNVLYVTTSNGSDDRLLRVVATATHPGYRPQLDISPSGVALVNRGGTLTAYVRGADGAVYFTSQATAGGPWSRYTRIPGLVASAPAAVSFGTRIHLFARGTNGHLLHTTTTGNSFPAWQDLGGALTSAPTAAMVDGRTIDVFARTGSGDSLSRIRWDGTRWTTWTNLGGIITAAPAASADVASGVVTVLAPGSDGRLCSIGVTATGVSSGWHFVTGRETWAAAAVSSSASPVVVTRNADLTPVVSAGGLTTAVGGLVTGAMAVAERPGSYAVVGRGQDNALWVFDGRPGHYGWSKVGGTLT